MVSETSKECVFHSSGNQTNIIYSEIDWLNSMHRKWDEIRKSVNILQKNKTLNL